MKKSKLILEIIFWVGAIIAIMGLVISSVGSFPFITRTIRPDIFAAENALIRLQHGGFAKTGEDGFSLLVRYGVCSIHRYADLDQNQIDMIGTDIWRMRKDPNPDPYETTLTLWYRGKQATTLTFSFRTIDEKFSEYVDNWKNKQSIYFGITGLVIMILTKLFGYYRKTSE